MCEMETVMSISPVTDLYLLYLPFSFHLTRHLLGIFVPRRYSQTECAIETYKGDNNCLEFEAQ